MSYIIGNNNGLIPRYETSYGPGSNDNYYVKVGADGSAIIDNDLLVKDDLTVNGNIYASTIVSIPDIALNPFYIKNDNNLLNATTDGINELPRNAVVIEAGIDRIDISGSGVGIATYKPISQKLISTGNAEDVGQLSCYGVDTSGDPVRYGAMRVSCVNPTKNYTQGRIDFIVRDGTVNEVLMQIDASTNIISTQGGARFNDRGYNLYPGGVKICETGLISYSATPVLVPETAFTIPTGLDGYYAYTVYINLNSVGDVTSANDYIITVLEIAGVGAIIGTENITTLVETAGVNTVKFSQGGVIPQRLTAGQTIQAYHQDSSPSFTYAFSSIRTTYTYLGDTAL